MPRRSARQRRVQVKSQPAAIQGTAKSRRYWWLAGLSGLTGILSLVLIAGWMDRSPGRMRKLAEAAARSGQWQTAREYWRAINTTEAASAFTHLEEARACLALGQASQAEVALQRSISADPANLEPWRLLLEILRVEDRTLEVLQAGWKAYENVQVEGRRALLREMTLGVLADLPDDLVRTTLRRWIDADDDDLDARIALLHRITIQPRDADPDRLTLLSELESIVARFPNQISAREVLVTAQADSGEPERGRVLLEDWPIDSRDARYWRLRGRWDLEYDHRPGDAVIAFRKALSELPQDWRSWYRLARALHVLGREDESTQAAEVVSRIREALDPLVLGPRLDAAFDHLDRPSALTDLDKLCSRLGLLQLGQAWRTEAQAAGRVSGASSH
jgi:tetratricopeptide (TPR) repeat protein